MLETELIFNIRKETLRDLKYTMEVNRDSKFLPNLMELEFERIIEKMYFKFDFCWSSIRKRKKR